MKKSQICTIIFALLITLTSCNTSPNRIISDSSISTKTEPISAFPKEHAHQNINSAQSPTIIRSGNCPVNAAEAFPDSIYVEFHAEGTEEFEKLEWSSLKIVMETFNGTLKVVAIIHSEYTL